MILKFFVKYRRISLFLFSSVRTSLSCFLKRLNSINGRLCPRKWLMLFSQALSQYMVVLFYQQIENICFFSKFFAGGLCDWGIYWLFLWNFKEIKHQLFSRIQPFLKVPKEQPTKCLSHRFRQRKNQIKKPYFHRTIEIKQPHTMTEPF